MGPIGLDVLFPETLEPVLPLAADDGQPTSIGTKALDSPPSARERSLFPPHVIIGGHFYDLL